MSSDAVEAATGRARAVGRSASAAATSTTRSRSSSRTSRSASSRPARTRARASTPPRPRACAGSPSRAALRVPEVLGVSDDVLVLDWVDEGARGDARAFGAGPGGDPRGGRGRALRRAAGSAAGGAGAAGGAAPCEPRRGAAPWPPCASGRCSLPNDPRPTGRRSTPSTGCSRCCRDAGLTARGNRAVESVCDRMHDLAGPPEPPARLHGDLWSGNVLWGRDGRAWLIDPAAYGGHREVDLAMLQLFGHPGPALLRRLRGAPPARAGLTRSASRSTSCSRCSCTPRCSAAATPRQPSGLRALRLSRGRRARRSDRRARAAPRGCRARRPRRGRARRSGPRRARSRGGAR